MLVPVDAVLRSWRHVESVLLSVWVLFCFIFVSINASTYLYMYTYGYYIIDIE